MNGLMSLPPRFQAKIRVRPSGCWLWTARRDPTWGYGRVRFMGRNALAHRAVYQLLVGPIPGDLTIDHLCRNTGCVNPEHLEPVTNRENILRGATIAAANAAKTHCIRGHPFDADNTTRPPRGGRQCRACSRAVWQARDGRRRMQRAEERRIRRAS